MTLVGDTPQTGGHRAKAKANPRKLSPAAQPHRRRQEDGKNPRQCGFLKFMTAFSSPRNGHKPKKAGHMDGVTAGPATATRASRATARPVTFRGRRARPVILKVEWWVTLRGRGPG